MNKNNNKAQTRAQFAGYNNRPYKIPDPKLLNIGVQYAITLNPSAQPYTYVEANGLFTGDNKAYHNEIMRIIRSLRNITLELTPELSGSGRWHYHGYAVIKDLAKFLIFDINIMKQYFCFEIDTIGETEEDKLKWKVYCSKGSHYMEKYCQDNKLPYQITSETLNVKVDKLNSEVKFEWCDVFDTNDVWVGMERKKPIDDTQSD